MSDIEYRFTVRPLTEEGAVAGWLVEYPDLPGCMSDGETIEEAIANAEDAKSCWIAAMKEAGRPIPPPSVEPPERYSGEWQLRAPKSLHRRLAERARREGVSLNTLVVTLLAEGLDERSAMAADTFEAEPAKSEPGLPEKIAPGDLDALNEARSVLFSGLRVARNLPLGETGGRLGAVVALSAVWRFLMRFEPVLAESLHVPLMSLHSALHALNENNVEPILKPTPRTGRATSSPRRYALIGIAVGAARRLEWTGLSPLDANEVIATELNALGVKPARGGGGVTAGTLRRWQDKINEVQPLLRSLPQVLQSELSAEDLGWINAAVNVDSMMTENWGAQITALATADARRFVLLALKKSISEMKLVDPANPPS
ncbi:MAG: type II toxin-antitoxin system HicB family antitoxin [Stellaceae bacterium]